MNESVLVNKLWQINRTVGFSGLNRDISPVGKFLHGSFHQEIAQVSRFHFKMQYVPDTRFQSGKTAEITDNFCPPLFPHAAEQSGAGI